MKNNKKNIGILLFTLVIVMMGFGLVIPIFPFYIEEFGASGSALGFLMAIFALMQFIFSPIWGVLSDRFGRKPIILIGVFGYAISMLLFGLATKLWMLFFARALAGILSSATMPTAMAFIGDSTDEENRGGGMGMMGAAMGVGMVIGPGIGGWLAEDSLSLPFFIAAGLSLLALIFVYLLLPESLSKENRSESSKINMASEFKLMWQSLFGPLSFLLILAFFVSFGLTNFEGVFGLYAAHRFDFGPREVGSLLTVVGVVSALAQGALTGPLSKKWGEEKIIKVTVFGSAIGFILMLFATDFLTIAIYTGLFVFSNSLIRPAVTSLTSKNAEVGQGIAMGMNNSFMSLGRIFGPMLAGILFDVQINLPYIIGGGVMLGVYFLCLVYLGKNQVTKSVPV